MFLDSEQDMLGDWFLFHSLVQQFDHFIFECTIVSTVYFAWMYLRFIGMFFMQENNCRVGID